MMGWRSCHLATWLSPSRGGPIPRAEYATNAGKVEPDFTSIFELRCFPAVDCARCVSAFRRPCDASSRENALALHLLLQGPESLIDIVIANEYPQTFSNRA